MMITNNRIIKRISDYYVYLLVIIISSLFFIISLCINNCMPFGDNFPLTGNGFIQDYPQFCKAVRSVKDGNLFGFLDYGTGIISDNYSIKSYSVIFLILRPFLYLLYLIIPRNLYIGVFFVYYYFNYFFSGPALIYYLTHRLNGKKYDIKDYRLIVLGLCYSMSTYSICFFVYFFRYLVYIPIVFLGIEKIVYENKPKLYLFTLAYYMATEAYYAFVLCIFIVLYYLTLDFDSPKDFLRTSIKLAGYSILSAGLSAFSLIPYFYKTRYSPYSSADGISPSLLKSIGSFITPITEYRFFNSGYNNSGVEVRTNIYCGLLLLLLFPIYYLIDGIGLKKKILNSTFLLIIYIGFFNQLVNFIFHGFHYQWQVPNRFAAFFIFVFIVMVSDVFIYIKNVSKNRIIISILSTMGLYIILCLVSLVYKNDLNNSVNDFVPSFLIMSVYSVIIVLLCLGKLTTKKAIVVYIMLGLEMIVSSFSTFSTVFYPSEEIKGEIEYSNNIIELTNRNSDMKIPFVLTERPRETSYQNMSYISGTHSLSYYTSSNYKQHFDILNRWGILFSKNITYYYTGSPLADMMLHVKYHTVNTDNDIYTSEYVPIDKENNILLYQNPYYLPLGIVLDDHILDEWNNKAVSYTNYESAFERDNEFSNAFGVANIYDEINIEPVSEEMFIDNNYYSIEEDASGNALYTYYIGEKTGGKLFMQIAGSLQYVGDTNLGECNTLYFFVPRSINVESDEVPKLAIWNEDSFNQLYNVLSSNTMYNQEYGENSIKGYVNVEKKSILYLAMPDIPGFDVYVDGKKESNFNYLDGIGVYLNPGTHSIELDYTPEGLFVGVIISFFSVLIFIIYSNITNKHKLVEVEK